MQVVYGRVFDKDGGSRTGSPWSGRGVAPVATRTPGRRLRGAPTIRFSTPNDPRADTAAGFRYSFAGRECPGQLLHHRNPGQSHGDLPPRTTAPTRFTDGSSTRTTGLPIPRRQSSSATSHPFMKMANIGPSSRVPGTGRPTGAADLTRRHGGRFHYSRARPSALVMTYDQASPSYWTDSTLPTAALTRSTAGFDKTRLHRLHHDGDNNVSPMAILHKRRPGERGQPSDG